MGLFEKIFGRKKDTTSTTTRFEMISDSGNGFYSWNGNLYHSDIIRSCIRPKYQTVGKLIAKHIRDNTNEFKVNPDVNIRFLLEEPNPLMTGQMLQEKLVTQLELNHNAFAYIKRNELGIATEIYPIPCSMVEVVEGVRGDIYLKFYFQNGKNMTIPYADVIHLRKDFNENDFFGEHPGKALKSLMEVIATTDQGIVKAIKNSNIIKWLLKFNQTLRPEDIKKNTQEFVDNFLNIETSATVGAAATDAKMDAQQVKPESYVPNAIIVKETVQRVYSFFGVNESIVQSKYTEDEWNAFYESSIEPIAIQLSGEFTRKLFSRRERGFGNKIIFESSSLQYASMATKMNLVQMVDRGAMTPNEWRSVLNLGPIEEGDKPIRRLDTALVGKGNSTSGGGDGDGQNGTKGTTNSNNGD